jgi:hypothetical protein
MSANHYITGSTKFISFIVLLVAVGDTRRWDSSNDRYWPVTADRSR